MVQVEFAKSIGEIDLSNLTDDFVEDVMLQSKPLQSILHAIRKRQRASSSCVDVQNQAQSKEFLFGC